MRLENNLYEKNTKFVVNKYCMSVKSFKEEIKTNLKDNKKLLLLNIMYTSAWLDQIYNPIFKKNGLTNSQFNILRILKGSSPDPLSVGEIKDRIMFKQTDITRMIDRLVEKGLVDRRLCDENRRKMDVSITDLGNELLNKINPEIDKAEETYLNKKITDKDALITGEILDKIRSK